MQFILMKTNELFKPDGCLMLVHLRYTCVVTFPLTEQTGPRPHKKEEDHGIVLNDTACTMP